MYEDQFKGPTLSIEETNRIIDRLLEVETAKENPQAIWAASFVAGLSIQLPKPS